MAPNPADPNESWLFRQGDLILGPVPTAALIEKIYSGELNATSEVQIMGSGTFRPLNALPSFKVHLAKAEAKSRVDAQAAQHNQTQRKKLMTTLGVGGGVAAVLTIVLAGVGSYLAVHAPTGAVDAEITIDTPTITSAKRGASEELVDYNGPTGKKPTAVAARVPGTPTTNTGAPTHAKPGTAAEPDGLQMGEVDQSAINAVVAQYKPTLIHCIKEIAQPGVFAKIPIEFTIGDNGKVSKVWVDNNDYRTGPLPDCLMGELQKWPFKASPSGGASVSLSFNIGKKG